MKRVRVLFFLLASLCLASCAEAYTFPQLSYSEDINPATESLMYSLYGYGDTDFFYQLRDITGATWASKVGGPQWFATVYENYSRLFNSTTTTTTNTTTRRGSASRGVYRRTTGGEIDSIPVSTIGDLLDGFNYVFVEEQEPYAAWLNRNIIDSRDYDIYPDPLESLCIITTGGQATVNVRFANPYARHFPFWWNWTRTTTEKNWRWWSNNYNWRDTGFYTVEPVAYIFNPSDNGIYSRGTSGLYEKIYTRTTSGDVYYIRNTAGVTLYVSSGDITSGRYSIVSNDSVACIVSGDAVYNSAGGLMYTVESALGDSCYYLCEVRPVEESIVVAGFDDYDYTVRVAPSSEQSILSGNYLDAKIYIQGDADTYGSRLGYIAFRQRASFMPGYTNFREVSPIPVVIANVSNGNASDNPLIFDMTVKDYYGRVIRRAKFTWDAQTDKTNQDLGTFFMMTPINSAADNYYRIETKITNRTGTRYQLYRYDRMTPAGSGYTNILPSYWQYDLTPDLYGTLPQKILLDAHSQIAPGLVTVYSDITSSDSTAYSSTINMGRDTSTSFSLYEYESVNPKHLQLNYRRIAGMISDGAPRGRTYNGVSDDLVTVHGFSMHFTDVYNDSENTVTEINSLTGKTPELLNVYDPTYVPVTPQYTYINSSALDAFTISEDVPLELQSRVSYDVIFDEVTPVSSDSTSDSTTNTTPTEEATTAATSSVKISGVKYTNDTYGKTAILPLSVRMKIDRQSQLLKDIWTQLDEAPDSRTLFNIFSRHASVWLRSSATSEKDANFFTAINNKGNSVGATAADCVSAFIYDNYLYLDFLVFIADGVSKNSNKTAYVEVFKDDGVPYVIVGDGQIDKHWDITFYIGAASENSTTASSVNQNSMYYGSGSVGSASSGGGCNVTGGLLALLGLAALLKIKR
ncbi:MAG: hypothetical protein IJR94_08375 [Synergistaceae bacterium]|nr:hypothetical protein [Synergistaceae bacterium]